MKIALVVAAVAFLICIGYFCFSGMSFTLGKPLADAYLATVCITFTCFVAALITDVNAKL